MQIKGDFNDFKNDNQENVTTTGEVKEVVNFNNIIEKEVKKEELNINDETLKEIKKLNDNFYVDKYGIIKEKIWYKIKKYTCRFFMISGLTATFYYGLILPYYENPNFADNRNFAFEKTNILSMKFFDYNLSGEEINTDNNVNTIKLPVIPDDKNKLIKEITKEINNESKIVKTISINDEIPKIEKESIPHNRIKNENNNTLKESEKKEKSLVKSIEEIPKEIIEKDITENNNIDKTEIKKPVLTEKKPVILEENKEVPNKIIDESSEFYQNNGNDFLNDERPKSDEPNDTKIDENLDEPIFDEKKNSIKKLMENTEIKESTEN